MGYRKICLWSIDVHVGDESENYVLYRIYNIRDLRIYDRRLKILMELLEFLSCEFIISSS